MEFYQTLLLFLGSVAFLVVLGSIMYHAERKYERKKEEEHRQELQEKLDKMPFFKNHEVTNKIAEDLYDIVSTDITEMLNKSTLSEDIDEHIELLSCYVELKSNRYRSSVISTVENSEFEKRSKSWHFSDFGLMDLPELEMDVFLQALAEILVEKLTPCEKDGLVIEIDSTTSKKEYGPGHSGYIEKGDKKVFTYFPGSEYKVSLRKIKFTVKNKNYKKRELRPW